MHTFETAKEALAQARAGMEKSVEDLRKEIATLRTRPSWSTFNPISGSTTLLSSSVSGSTSSGCVLSISQMGRFCILSDILLTNYGITESDTR